jgi:hypothetical protein
MKKSRSAERKTPVRPPVSFDQAPKDSLGFMSLFERLISWKELCGLTARKNGAGRPTHKLSRGQLLVAIVFHYTINGAGTLAQHLLILMGISMSDGTLSERRQALPFEVFTDLLRRVLRPLSQPSKESFYRGLRLVAIDGVEFSVANTPAVNQRLGKSRNQHSTSAFAKLRCSALVELLLHNPLAAALGREGQSEWELTKDLLQHLPQKCLLLADRLYGCGAFILQAQKILKLRGGHFLLRIKIGAKVAEVVERLFDGSALVKVHALVPGSRHRHQGQSLVREIRAVLRRKGCPPITVRFWTSLLDPQQWPAQELVKLYATRWEHELYFRGLKSVLGTNNLLRSQTVETAAQEVVAMIIASALIAGERSKLKPGEELTHRISFLKVWDLLQPLWLTLLLGTDILSEPQKQQLVDRFYWMASQMKMTKKRQRSCPRVTRQRQARWPRKTDQKSINGPIAVRVIQTQP